MVLTSFLEFKNSNYFIKKKYSLYILLYRFKIYVTVACRPENLLKISILKKS